MYIYICTSTVRSEEAECSFLIWISVFDPLLKITLWRSECNIFLQISLRPRRLRKPVRCSGPEKDGERRWTRGVAGPGQPHPSSPPYGRTVEPFPCGNSQVGACTASQPYKQNWESGSCWIRNFFLDPDPELFVSDPDPGKKLRSR